MLRAPKSAAALPSDDSDGKDGPDAKFAEATVTDPSGGALGSTEELLIPETALRSMSALAVKFCTIRSVPPKSTTAIMRSGPALASINLLAAPRAWICSG